MELSTIDKSRYSTNTPVWPRLIGRAAEEPVGHLSEVPYEKLLLLAAVSGYLFEK